MRPLIAGKESSHCQTLATGALRRWMAAAQAALGEPAPTEALRAAARDLTRVLRELPLEGPEESLWVLGGRPPSQPEIARQTQQALYEILSLRPGGLALLAARLVCAGLPQWLREHVESPAPAPGTTLRTDGFERSGTGLDATYRAGVTYRLTPEGIMFTSPKGLQVTRAINLRQPSHWAKVTSRSWPAGEVHPALLLCALAQGSAEDQLRTVTYHQTRWNHAPGHGRLKPISASPEAAQARDSDPHAGQWGSLRWLEDWAARSGLALSVCLHRGEITSLHLTRPEQRRNTGQGMRCCLSSGEVSEQQLSVSSRRRPDPEPDPSVSSDAGAPQEPSLQAKLRRAAWMMSRALQSDLGNKERIISGLDGSAISDESAPVGRADTSHTNPAKTLPDVTVQVSAQDCPVHLLCGARSGAQWRALEELRQAWAAQGPRVRDQADWGYGVVWEALGARAPEAHKTRNRTP